MRSYPSSPITRKKALNAKLKVSQPKVANIKSPGVSVMDRLVPANTDLRDYLSNKRKLEELFTSRRPSADKRGVNL